MIFNVPKDVLLPIIKRLEDEYQYKFETANIALNAAKQKTSSRKILDFSIKTAHENFDIQKLKYDNDDSLELFVALYGMRVLIEKMSPSLTFGIHYPHETRAEYYIIKELSKGS